MPRYYVDLDNNRLVTGPQSTVLATTPRLVQGDKPVLDVELLTRTNNVLGYYTSTASAINVRVGTLGGTAVASALTFSPVTISAMATATAGISVPVTATGTVKMLGSIPATSTANMTSPVTGSVVVTFSQVQMPTIVPVIRSGFLDSLEVPTCGKNFSVAPSINVSFPDTLSIQVVNFDIQGQGEVSFYTAPNSGSFPEVFRLNIEATANMIQGGQYSLTLYTRYGITNFGTFAGPVPTGPNVLTDQQSATYVIDDPTILGGDMKIRWSQMAPSTAVSGGSTPPESFITGSVRITKLASSDRAAVGSVILNNTLQVSVASAGSSYRSNPDVFIVPSNNDYDLGSAVSITSAQISSRTVVVTKTNHGLFSGGHILVENLPTTSTKSGIQAGGIWPIQSATTDSFIFRIDRPVCLATTALSLDCTNAKVYPIVFRSLATSVSISSAGSGYAPGVEIPFEIQSESCSGIPVRGVITTSNSGSLAYASITCAGSGFSSTSTIISLKTYKSVASVSVVCAGAGYWTTAPAITVSNTSFDPNAPGAAQAVLQSTLLGNGQIQISVISSGYGYASAPSISIDLPNLGDGIREVSIATPGIGYSDGTFACAVSAAPSGGSDAKVNFVKNGDSQSFVVVNAGRGYPSAPPVTVPAPDIGGTVDSITITCAGAAYVENPMVTFVGGNGQGASGTAILSNGSVSSISLISRGSGYTSAPSVTLSAPPSSVFYRKQIDLSSPSVTTLLAGNSSVAATLQIEEKTGGETTVLAQVPITVLARIN